MIRFIRGNSVKDFVNEVQLWKHIYLDLLTGEEKEEVHSKYYDMQAHPSFKQELCKILTLEKAKDWKIEEVYEPQVIKSSKLKEKLEKTAEESNRKLFFTMSGGSTTDRTYVFPQTEDVDLVFRAIKDDVGEDFGVGSTLLSISAYPRDEKSRNLETSYQINFISNPKYNKICGFNWSAS